MTNKYKCVHLPGGSTKQADLICRGCLKAWIARHDRMLEFIKELSAKQSKTGWYECRCADQIAEEAAELLIEIGHVKAEDL